MKFSFNWLKTFINTDLSASDIADKLSSAGLEVEGFEEIGKGLTGIVTGKIQSIAKHPNADRLVITQIFDGTDTHQIVTGATNVFEGAIVPASLPGAVLADGTKIKKGVLRGVDSYGMLCSEKELGIADESHGIWILPEDTPLGIDFVDYALLKDVVFDISILPNRGDCQSIVGLARELSVILDTPLSLPEPVITESGKTLDLTVTIQDERCPIYTARVIRNVTIKPSPLWMQRRLQVSGIRPINLAVDITNYILLEWGQPLHAFDYHRTAGAQITVRSAHSGEKLTALDAADHTLEDTMLMICDQSGPIAIAGVMGGERSGIADDTQDIILEAAYFHPGSVRKAASKLGLRSESSVRFEKGIDIDQVVRSANRAAQLFQELAGATLEPIMIKSNPSAEAFQKRTLTLDPAKLNQLLGTDYPTQDILDILQKLGFHLSPDQSDITVPSWRHLDILGTPDLAEEVARLKGFDTIPSVLPTEIVLGTPPTHVSKQIAKLENFLVHTGIMQLNTYTMIAQKDLQGIVEPGPDLLVLNNPLSPEHAVMRPHMLPSVLKILAYNVKRQADRLSVFEVGKTFHKAQNSQAPLESVQLVALITGTPQVYFQAEKAVNTLDFYKLKGLWENLADLVDLTGYTAQTEPAPSYLHPVRQLTYLLDGQSVGEVGFLHPELLKEWDLGTEVGYISLNVTVATAKQKATPTYTHFSKHPSTRRDIALLAPKQLPYGDLYQTLQEVKSDLVQEIFMFDYFESEKLGPDNKSVAVGMIYQATDKTLSDEEVNQAHETLCRQLTERLPVHLR